MMELTRNLEWLLDTWDQPDEGSGTHAAGDRTSHISE
jgi:hypothetical protein